jgi:hypothetical protein
MNGKLTVYYIAKNFELLHLKFKSIYLNQVSSTSSSWRNTTDGPCKLLQNIVLKLKLNKPRGENNYLALSYASDSDRATTY